MERGEEQLSDLFGFITLVAFLIAGLGLFALSAFIAERRSREITIRKVLGATSIQILKLLSRNFLGMILLSLIIASPIAWYLVYRWLQEFAFRITMGLDVFLLAGLIVVVVSLFTISYQSVKAALVNPVVKLKTE